jgi:uncharacterized protein (DUF952 family)
MTPSPQTLVHVTVVEFSVQQALALLQICPAVQQVPLQTVFVQPQMLFVHMYALLHVPQLV